MNFYSTNVMSQAIKVVLKAIKYLIGFDYFQISCFRVMSLQFSKRWTGVLCTHGITVYLIIFKIYFLSNIYNCKRHCYWM